MNQYLSEGVAQKKIPNVVTLTYLLDDQASEAMANKYNWTAPFLLPISPNFSQTFTCTCLFYISPSAVHTVQELSREILEGTGRCVVF
jgi:hypothetical protein